MRNALAGLILVSQLLCVDAFGQNADVLLPFAGSTGEFNEAFFPAARVSGSIIVGASIGQPPDVRFNSRLPNYQVGGVIGSGNFLCVRALTSDGQFFSENAFILPSHTDRILARPEYITSRYRRVVRHYNFSEIAFRARFSTASDCNQGSQVSAIAPAVYNPNSNVLTILVNAQGARAHVWLLNSDSDERLAGDCSIPPEGPHLTYDRICALTFPPMFGNSVANLVIRLEGRLGSSNEYETMIYLPAQQGGN